MASSSTERVRAALLAQGHPDTIQAFPDGTRSAAQAAQSVGCSVAQIVKSMVFRSGERPVLVLTSGVNRVDPHKVTQLLGQVLQPADGNWVRQVTGFAIGGVAPVGHQTPPLVVIDQDLLALSPLWAAAGSPLHAFATEAQALLEMTGGRVADVRQD